MAARRLLAAGKRPLVVEARERVGGRLLNQEIGDGKVVEVGGQWIGPTQERLAALAAELGVGTFPTHDEGRHLIEMAGKLTSYTGALTDARVGRNTRAEALRAGDRGGLGGRAQRRGRDRDGLERLHGRRRPVRRTHRGRDPGRALSLK